jgi:uncharacterized protein YidB (DUF937 family)
MDDQAKSAAQPDGGITTGAGLDPAGLVGLQGAILQEGGIDGLMTRLRDGGLGAQVDSWVSSGENQPVGPDRLQQALGPDTVQRLSASSGLNISQLLPMLAMFLPQIINMLTPDGHVPSGGLNQAAGQMDVGSLIGGLLGGAGGAGGAGGLDELLGGLGGMFVGNRN